MPALTNLDHLREGDEVYVETGRTRSRFNGYTVTRVAPKQVKVALISNPALERTFRRDDGSQIGGQDRWDQASVWATDDPEVVAGLCQQKVALAIFKLNETTEQLRNYEPGYTPDYYPTVSRDLDRVIKQARQLHDLVDAAERAAREN